MYCACARLALMPPPGLAPEAARSRLRAALPLLLLLLAAALGALLLLAPQQLLSSQVRARRVAAALVLTAAAAGERSLRAVSGAGPAAPPSSSAASLAATRVRAERPFRAVVRIHSLACGTEKGDAYRPHFTYTLFPPDGAYPVLVVADVALVCATRTLTLVSRHYFRRPDLDHTRLVVHVRDRASGARVRLAARSWHVARKYETVAIGEFEYDGGVACDGAAAAAAAPGGDDARDAPTVEVEVSYSGTGTGAAACPNAHSTFAVARSPSPPRSRWAMVAVFSFSRFLLRAWMDYWRAIGVGTFYLFHNGRSDELESVMASFDNDLRASIVLVDWQVLHWILTDDADVTHGQPMAINDALHRWHHLHPKNTSTTGANALVLCKCAPGFGAAAGDAATAACAPCGDGFFAPGGQDVPCVHCGFGTVTEPPSAATGPEACQCDSGLGLGLQTR